VGEAISASHPEGANDQWTQTIPPSAGRLADAAERLTTAVGGQGEVAGNDHPEWNE
jgi:hypothetical protein